MIFADYLENLSQNIYGGLLNNSKTTNLSLDLRPAYQVKLIGL